MGHEGLIALYVVLAVYAVAWFALVATNAWRLVQIVGLQGEDRADNRGWMVWTASVASLFAGCLVAVIVWGAVEWVLPPPDPFEDSIGTIHLMSLARTNLGFVIVSNVVVGLVVAFVVGVSTSA